MRSHRAGSRDKSTGEKIKTGVKAVSYRRRGGQKQLPLEKKLQTWRDGRSGDGEMNMVKYSLRCRLAGCPPGGKKSENKQQTGGIKIPPPDEGETNELFPLVNSLKQDQPGEQGDKNKNNIWERTNPITR